MLFVDYLKKFYIYLIIFFLGLGFRIYALSTEPELHIDEPSSFVVATVGNNLDENIIFKPTWNHFYFKYDKEYKAKKVQDAFFVAQKSPSSIIKDLKILRDNNIDRQHPTLYHSLLRLWNTPLGDFEYHKYLNHARALNLVFYTLSFFFMFKLLSLIKDDKRFISLGLFFGFLNCGGIMIDTMAREYALIEAFLIITTYIAFVIGKKIVDNENIKIAYIVLYPIGFSLFLSACYLSVIYMGIVACVLTLLCIIYKRWYLLFQLFVIFLLTACFTILIYPSYFDFSTNNEHYKYAEESITGFSASNLSIINISDLLKHIDMFVFRKIIYLPIIIIICFLFIFKSEKFCCSETFRKKELISLLILIGCAGLWAILVNNTVKYKYFARYIMPAVSIYCLLIVLFIYRFKSVLSYIFVFILAFSTFLQIPQKDFTDRDRVKFKSFNKVRIPTNTYLPKNKPIVIVSDRHYPIEHIMFASINPETTIIFRKKLPDKDFKYGNYTLVCKRDLMKNKKFLFEIRNKLRVYNIEKNEN